MQIHDPLSIKFPVCSSTLSRESCRWPAPLTRPQHLQRSLSFSRACNVDVVNGDTVDADNAIAGHDAACGDLDADELPDPVRRRARRHAQIRIRSLLPVSACRRALSCSSTSMPSAGRMYLAGLYELRHHAHDGIDRHRKAYAGRGARRTG